MRQNTTLRLWFLLLMLATSAAFAAGPSLSGKWVVKSFDYKYANDPEKDYPLSRNDYERMVKAEQTFEFSASGMLTLSYLKADYPELHAFIFDGKTLKFSASAVSTSEVLAGASSAGWLERASVFEVQKRGKGISLIQQNQTWKLSLNLERVQ